jgi:hypothetical protein
MNSQIVSFVAGAAAAVLLAGCSNGAPLGPGEPNDDPTPPASFDLTFEQTYPLYGDRSQIRLYPSGHFTHVYVSADGDYWSEGNYHWAVASNSLRKDRLHLRFTTYAFWEGFANVRSDHLDVQFTGTMSQLGFADGVYHLIPNEKSLPPD